MTVNKYITVFVLSLFFIVTPTFLNASSKKSPSFFYWTETAEDVEKLISSSDVVYEIPFSNNTVRIYKDKILRDEKCEDEKLIVVSDKYDNILDYKVVEFLDRNDPSFYSSKDSFCLKVDYTNKKTGKFIIEYIYVNDKKPYIKSFPIKNNWVASGLISNGYILYSTEYESSSIKKINLDTGNISLYDYEYDYPNVELYENIDNEKSLAIFCYKDKWYEIYEDKIVPSNLSYEVSPKKKLSDFTF